MKFKKRVLVVEDMKNWRELLVRILSPEYDVTAVDSFEKAKEAIAVQTDSFHVAILDIRLKDDDSNNRQGLEIARLLKFMGEYTKTIILTGYPTIETVKEAITDCSVYEYLEKVPEDGEKEFDPDEFCQIVRKAASKASQLNLNRNINSLLSKKRHIPEKE